MDDAGCTSDSAGIHVYYSDGDEAFTEILPGTAELPWRSQRSDRRKLRRS